MQNLTLQILNAVGLHARPAAEFVKLAAQFKSSLRVRNVSTKSSAVDAKSIISVLTLGVEKGHEIELTADGADEKDALSAIRELIESDFAGKF
jgi:phosphotransferase system HPr (HPr) family protein